MVLFISSTPNQYIFLFFKSSRVRVRVATFFAVSFAGVGVGKSPGSELVSPVTVGVFITRHVLVHHSQPNAGLPCYSSVCANNSAVYVSICM